MANTSERYEGPTEHGGAYAVAYWRDADGHSTTREQARRFEFVEYGAHDEQLFRTYCEVGQQAAPPSPAHGRGSE